MAGVCSKSADSTGGGGNNGSAGVSGCGDNRIVAKILTAYGTGSAKRPSVLGTGGSLVGALLCSMSERADNRLCNGYFVTNGAVLTLGKTGLGTGGSFCRIGGLGMSESRDLFGGCAVANGTGKSLSALLGTGRKLVVGRLVLPIVCRGDRFGNSVAAGGTGPGGGAVLGTGSINDHGIAVGVAGSRYRLGPLLVTERASEFFCAVLGTGSRGRCLSLTPLVGAGRALTVALSLTKATAGAGGKSYGQKTNGKH